jgi:hypothetical protein
MQHAISWLAIGCSLVSSACSSSTSLGPHAAGGDESGGGGAGGGAAACAASDDHASDPKNCGACGHDCLGGACTNGRCQPFELWKGGRALGPLFADDAYVYWVTESSNGVIDCPRVNLVRAPKFGETTVAHPESVTRGQPIYDLALRGGDVYYGVGTCHDGEDKRIRRFPVDAAAPAITTIATLHEDAVGLAPASDALYLLSRGAMTPPYPTDVVSQPLTGGPTTIVAPGQDDAELLTTDDTYLYWQFESSQEIVVMPISGGAPSTLVSAAEEGFDAVGIAVADGSNVFYQANSQGVVSVQRLALGETGAGQAVYTFRDIFLKGSNETSLGSRSFIDAGDDLCFIYSTATLRADSVGCVAKTADDTQDVTTLLAGTLGIGLSGLGADADAVYWVSGDGDHTYALYRVVK